MRMVNTWIPKTRPALALAVTMMLGLCGAAPGCAGETPDHSFSKPERPPQYQIIDDRFGYQLIWRPRKEYRIDNFEAAHLAIHSCQEEPQGGPWTYNWAARREPCTIVSGDLPRFALMRTYREPTVAPAFHKMGDLRIRLTSAGQSVWLDECSPVKSQFFPWGTVHRIDLRPQIPRTVEVTTFLAANRGLAVQVTVEANAAESGAPLAGELEFFYGGMDSKGPNFIPPYLLPDAKEALNDQWKLEPAGAVLTDPAMPDRVRLAWQPQGTPRLHQQAGDETDNRLEIRHALPAGAARQQFQFLACQMDPALGPDLAIQQFGSYGEEIRQYYSNVLKPYEIRTPDTFLNAAFYAALINLDYTWQPPAWLEGIHEWNSYYCDNYQISAAIDLGQLKRAREALLFFGKTPGGPAAVAFSSGPSGDPAFEDGLPYYILQLSRYWRATGDKDAIEQLWKPTSENLVKMLKKRDPEGNMLLNWHQGCNAFLYQADHLGQPGDAPSPTFMAIGNLEQMAELAQARGDAEQAKSWRHQAAYMREEALRRLWRPSEGRLAAIDTQGLAQASNYYTDFAFPILYGGIPAEQGWILLRTLDRTLWVGDHLMRSGNLKPPLFGNDMMGPVQMSEASEAYFASGRAERGWGLLHGVALAATTYTNSPGAFPEYMTNKGYGQADWIFGNPTAAYIHATVGGLFGFERRAPDTPARWHPVLPADWAEAALKLDDVTMSATGRHGDRRYVISFSKPQALACRLPLYGHQVTAVQDAAGKAIAYKLEPHPGGGFLTLECPPATHHEIHLLSKPVAPLAPPTLNASGSTLQWELPQADMAASDPLGLFKDYRIKGKVLTASLAGFEGPQLFFLQDRQNQRLLPVELKGGKEWANPLDQHPPAVELKGKRQPLDLASYFNTETFNGRNVWRFGANKIDLTPLVTQVEGRSLLKVGDTQFQVRPAGRNILGLERGALNGMTTELYLTGMPWKTSFAIGQPGQPLRGIELLTACELSTRLTGMQIGQVTLCYHDGSRRIEPLVYGRNIDCYTESFASGVKTLKLGPVANLAAFGVEADPQRSADRIEIEVSVPEAFVGILGVNLVLAE